MVNRKEDLIGEDERIERTNFCLVFGESREGAEKVVLFFFIYFLNMGKHF